MGWVRDVAGRASELPRIAARWDLRQLPLLLILAFATAVKPWNCGADGMMVSEPGMPCDPGENASYLVMLLASIVLVPLGCARV